MWRLAALALTVAAAGACAPGGQGKVDPYVGAVEVKLETDADRRDLIAILRKQSAADGGLHVDDVSENWRQVEAMDETTPPGERSTLYVGVWRGADDEKLEAQADDHGHTGRAWITFLNGPKPDRSARYRQAVLADIRSRWPDSRLLPILPSGGLPLARDLRPTASGYGIAAESAAAYELPANSPLLAK
jgi:hypothetical protein